MGVWGDIPGGNGMPVWSQHPCLGAGSQSHPQFHPCKNQQGMDSRSSPKEGEFGIELSNCYMGNEKDVLAMVFSCQNEHDREGSGLTIINS